MGACVSSPHACVGLKPRSSDGLGRKRRRTRRRKKGKSELKTVAGSSRLSDRSSERGDCCTASVADSTRAPGSNEEAWFDSSVVLDNDWDDDLRSVPEGSYHLVLLHRETDNLMKDHCLSPEELEALMEINETLKRMIESSRKHSDNFNRRMSDLEKKMGYTRSPQPTPTEPTKFSPSPDFVHTVLAPSEPSKEDELSIVDPLDGVLVMHGDVKEVRPETSFLVIPFSLQSCWLLTKNSMIKADKFVFQLVVQVSNSHVDLCAQGVRQNANEKLHTYVPPAKPPDELDLTRVDVIMNSHGERCISDKHEGLIMRLKKLDLTLEPLAEIVISLDAGERTMEKEQLDSPALFLPNSAATHCYIEGVVFSFYVRNMTFSLCTVGVNGWLEAFTAHPLIGQRVLVAGHDSNSKNDAQWNKEEQSTALATAIDSTWRELSEWNAKYIEKFGFVFLICALGRSSPDILAELKQMVSNRPIVEFEMAAHEMMKITELRLIAPQTDNCYSLNPVMVLCVLRMIRAHTTLGETLYLDIPVLLEFDCPRLTQSKSGTADSSSNENNWLLDDDMYLLIKSGENYPGVFLCVDGGWVSSFSMSHYGWCLTNKNDVSVSDHDKLFTQNLANVQPLCSYMDAHFVWAPAYLWRRLKCLSGDLSFVYNDFCSKHYIIVLGNDQINTPKIHDIIRKKLQRFLEIQFEIFIGGFKGGTNLSFYISLTKGHLKLLWLIICGSKDYISNMSGQWNEVEWCDSFLMLNWHEAIIDVGADIFYVIKCWDDHTAARNLNEILLNVRIEELATNLQGSGYIIPYMFHLMALPKVGDMQQWKVYLNFKSYPPHDIPYYKLSFGFAYSSVGQMDSLSTSSKRVQGVFDVQIVDIEHLLASAFDGVHQSLLAGFIDSQTMWLKMIYWDWMILAAILYIWYQYHEDWLLFYVHMVSSYISQDYFSLPRPPEFIDLEDKVPFKGGGMLRVKD